MSEKTTIEQLAEIIQAQNDFEPTTYEDICNHGADGGFGNFIYYRDTVKFYDENEELIWALLDEQCEELGYKNPMEMIASFGGVKNVYGGDQFKNLLSWYALEEVARYQVDQSEVEV